MIHRTDLPDHLAGFRIQRIDRRAGIAEEDRRSAVGITEGDARADLRCRLESPVRASGSRRRGSTRLRSAIAMNTRPPTMVGCDRAIVTAPRLNAHFSLSAGTFEAVRPALRASWNRELVTLVLHPFHRGAFIADLKAADAKERRSCRFASARERLAADPPVGAM